MYVYCSPKNHVEALPLFPFAPFSAQSNPATLNFGGNFFFQNKFGGFSFFCPSFLLKKWRGKKEERGKKKEERRKKKKRKRKRKKAKYLHHLEFTR